jgi:DNA polymerase-3 subunit epsilon
MIVFDLGTTGLNVRRDVVISIGAVALHGGRIALDQQFSEHVQQTRISGGHASLAHRLTAEELQHADLPDQVLPRFVAYKDGAPSFAYHADFDDDLMRKSLATFKARGQWSRSIDVAHWLLWLHPELGPMPLTLDQALEFARISVPSGQRHQALSDEMLTAQLVLTMLPQTLHRGVGSFERLKISLRYNASLRRMRSAGW